MAVVNGENYRYIDMKNDSGTVRHMLEDTQARDDVADLKSATKESDYSLHQINSYINDPTVGITTYLASWSWENDTRLIIGTTSAYWGAIFLNKTNIVFSHSGQTGKYLDYIVLGTCRTAGNFYVICLSIGSNRFGQLVAVRLHQTLSKYTFDGTSHLSSESYDNFRKYTISYQGNGVYTVVNGDYTDTIDISNFSIVVDNVTVTFDEQNLGFAVNSSHGNKDRMLVYGVGINRTAWNGRKWFAFGDSITYRGHYIPTANNLLGTMSTKFGHSGYSYAELATVYTEMIDGTTPDVITLFAGTNDFGHNGTISDMVSGMRTIIDGLYTAYPKVQLIIITPLQRNYSGSASGEIAGLGPNNLGKYLIDYVNAIKEIAQEYSIPCLDLYSCGGINMNNVSVKTEDGLHPIATYGAVLGHQIGNFILGYMPFD